MERGKTPNKIIIKEMVIDMKKANSKKVNKVWVTISAVEFALIFISVIFQYVTEKCLDTQALGILAIVTMMFCAEWEIYKNKKLIAAAKAE